VAEPDQAENLLAFPVGEVGDVTDRVVRRGALQVTVTDEYANGAIRTTFAAVPQRGAVIIAKLTVLCVVVFAFGQVIAFACFLATQAILHPAHLGMSLRSPLGAVLGAGAYLPVAAAIGAGIGTLARRTATPLGTIVVLLFLLPGMAQAFPAPWSNRISNALPSTAAQAISHRQRSRGHAHRPRRRTEPGLLRGPAAGRGHRGAPPPRPLIGRACRAVVCRTSGAACKVSCA
jgi:hypothetical protein